MRRIAYPYGRYIIEKGDADDISMALNQFIEDIGYPVVKYDAKNENKGTLIIAVNREADTLGKLTAPVERLGVIMAGLISDFSEKELDIKAQRIGIEFYIWPIKEDVLLEVFVLPYMEHFNHKEIFHLTESPMEEITDWYLCETVWAHLIPLLEERFELKSMCVRSC